MMVPARSAMVRLMSLLVLFSFGAMSLIAADDADPKKTFDDVFGETYRKAASSPSTVDDVELARELAKAVTTVEMPASLIQVIIERMTLLSDKAAGALLPTVQAIDKLASIEKDAGKKAALELQAIGLLEKASETGDASSKSTAAVMLIDRLIPLADNELAQRKVESAHARYTKALKLAKEHQPPRASAIAAKLNLMDAAMKDAGEVDALEKRIGANPKDIEARRRLIEIHLVKRDDPSAAVWFAEGADAKTSKLLPLAAREGANADAATLMELADWYAELGQSAAASDKPAMFKRAKGYYEKFLTLHKEDDLRKAKATLALTQIERQLKDSTDAASAQTPVKPPGSTPAPPAATGAGTGALTVEIQGTTITEPDRVERLYQQQWRQVAKEYVALGKEFRAVLDFDPKFPSSSKETLAAVKARMTTSRVERVGLLRKTVVTPPVPAEAEAVAMGLPTLSPGAYGYLHSVEVVEVLGEDEMVVKNFWLVDRSTLDNVDWDQRKEREALVRRQNDWNFAGNTMRLYGHPTAGLKPGERVGIGGKTGKPLQVYIVTTETQNNVFKPNSPVATLTSKLLKGGIDEKQFADLLEKRNLTRTDFVNIFLESQRTSLKDAVPLTIRRIESSGAKLP